ncbi:MAG: hypothetical protein Q4D61_01975 [Cardiobacteriaceae bacterium]|nr:hypothetical protein [Cardiobacteriaceae bacterium]
MRNPIIFLIILPWLAACVHSEYHGHYTSHSQLRYGNGQTLHQSHHAHWQENAYTPPAVNLHLQHGGQHLHYQHAPPAPPPIIHTYPILQPAPAAPYIRSQRSIIPLCTQQTRVQHNGQTHIIQHPCR